MHSFSVVLLSKPNQAIATCLPLLKVVHILESSHRSSERFQSTNSWKWTTQKNLLHLPDYQLKLVKGRHYS